MLLSPFGLSLCPTVQPTFECWALNSMGLNPRDVTPDLQKQAEQKLAPLFRQHGFPDLKGNEAMQAIRTIRQAIGVNLTAYIAK